jgi:hypothetical protein
VGWNAQAGVSLKNGNFFVGYTDLVASGQGFELEVRRIYNSQSSENNPNFGPGWGDRFSTEASVAPDLTLVIHEHGGGDTTTYQPKNYSKAHLKKASKAIVKAAIKQGMSKGQANQMTSKLESDFYFRSDMAEKYGVEPDLKTGTKLYSDQRGSRQLVYIADKFYVRQYADGRRDFFARNGKIAGKLIKKTDKAGNELNFEYDKSSGALARVSDNKGRFIKFTRYPNGRVKTATGPGKNNTARYQYYDNGSLKQSIDAEGNTYIYHWDQHFNLVKVSYPEDDTELEILYQKDNNYVTKVVDRDGTVTEYDYEESSSGGNKTLKTSVVVTRPTGRKIKSAYQYTIKKRSNGEPYTYKLVSNENGQITSTIYNECCGLPIQIKKGNQVTTFKYNDGLMTEKVKSNGDAIRIQYDMAIRKPKVIRTNDGWTKFAYDKSGNLQVAQNNDGFRIELDYNRQNKIDKLVSKEYYSKKERRQLASKKKGQIRDMRMVQFKYDAQENPKVIRLDILSPKTKKMKKVGVVSVSYRPNGTISDVKSSDGPRVPIEISKTLGKVMAMVGPLGRELNFDFN